MEALILGIIQGLTEFMPISSSAHMEFAKALFGEDIVTKEGVAFNILVHSATALATLIAFRDQVSRFFKGLIGTYDKLDFYFSLSLIVSMIPAAIVGFYFEEVVDAFIGTNIVRIALLLMVTGILLVIANNTPPMGNKPINPGIAFIMGIVQALAILPGLSRSGTTISTALYFRVSREEAVKFSFLMVVPLALGRLLRDVYSGNIVFDDGVPQYLAIGFISAFFTGLWVCRWMVSIVIRANLNYFALYCFLVGIIAILAYFISW